MIDKGLRRLTAVRLRMILVISMFIIMIVTAIGFYFIQAHLYSFAVEVSHMNEDASTSGNDVATWERIKQRLEDDQATVTRTKNIVAASQAYEYQDQIITDLNTYASRSGVAISSYSFGGATGAAGAAAAAANSKSTLPTISGLKSVTVSVTLVTPTKYNNLMKFIHSIEQNLTKMQVASISITKGTANDEVSINTLEIEVYTK